MLRMSMLKGEICNITTLLYKLNHSFSPVYFVECSLFLDYLNRLDIQKCPSVRLPRRARQLFLGIQRSWLTVIPRTITTMPTCSQGQQQLRTAAKQLPILDQYGCRNDVMLQHPRVTALQEEEGPRDTTSSSGQADDIATSSPFSPLMQIWTYHRCEQSLNGPSHQRGT